MTRPALEYEPASRARFWTPERRHTFKRVLRIHCVASYGTLGMFVIVRALHGQFDAVMLAWTVLAPLATLVFLPVGCVIVMLPIEPSATPLIVVGLPYLTIVLLMVWREARTRTHTR